MFVYELLLRLVKIYIKRASFQTYFNFRLLISVKILKIELVSLALVFTTALVIAGLS